jgi:transposase-like protein
LDQGRQFFLLALDLLRDPQGFYQRGNSNVKHALTKVIFAKLYLDATATTNVSAHDLTQGVGDLVEAEQQRRTYHRRSDTLRERELAWNDNRPLPKEGPAPHDLSSAELLAWSLDQGSSKALMVGFAEALSHTTHQTNRLLQTALAWTIRPAKSVRRSASYRTMRQLTVDDVDSLVDAFRSGTTIRALAAEYGVHRTTVAGHLRGRGIDTRPPGLHPDDVPRAVELYQDGWSLQRIAEKFGCNPTTVYRRLLEVEVPMRDPHGRER